MIMTNWDVLPPEPITDRTTPPDVYRYTNDTAPVLLCLSCAAKRRRDGRTVNLVGDDPRPTRGKCADCGTVRQGVLL